MRVAVFLPELLRHLFKKPNTVDYPFKKLEVPPGFRGTPFLHPEICIACRACERDCPAEAIVITQVSDVEKKFRLEIHNDRCVHCAQCVDSCPKEALEATGEFALARLTRDQLRLTYRGDPARVPDKST